MAFDDMTIANEIARQCQTRGEGKTICPSEVARALAPDEEEWRALMPDIRRIAGQMAEQGIIQITKKGQAIDRREISGPIRLGLPGGTRSQ